MRYTTRYTFLLLVLSVFGLGLQAADNYDLDWFTLESGSLSLSNNYSLEGTIGQPDAGIMSGGTLTLNGGFWSSTQTIDALPGPKLNALLSGNSITISWPTSSNVFVLEVASSLSPRPDWMPSPEPQVTLGVRVSVTVSTQSRIKFYRLRKQ